jgi:hypothetical protein
MVEASVVLPFFLAIMVILIKVAIFCFNILRFQYEVSEITRQAFTLGADQRATIAGQSGTISWQQFIVSQINLKAQAIGLATSTPANTASVIFASDDSTCSTWSCATQAEPGHVFSLSINLREPILGSTLAGISWANINCTVKAIAFVQKDQNEVST